VRLAGKTAIITGAGQGIGRAAAELFAKEGANLVLADIDPAGEEVAAALREQGFASVFAQTDVSAPAAVQAAIDLAVTTYGRLNIVYNNAGGSIPTDGFIVDTTDEAFWRTLGVNTFGTWLFCKFGIPQLIAAGGGAIINTSSLTALRGMPQRDAYVASKGAVDALTRSMAIKYGAQGVRVNSIAPGIVLSARGLDHLAAGRLPQPLIDRHVLGPLSPLQIAQAALFLASDDASGITGHTLPVDAGCTIG
jgi:NAD(P)-dependent dehydrogenase (short-subunit alcohol dehydrogenase family)